MIQSWFPGISWIRASRVAGLLVLLLAGCGVVTPLWAAEGAAPASTNSVSIPKIRVAQFEELKVKPNHVVLDVRTPGEYKEGHIAGSQLINFQDPDFARQVRRLDKSKTYIVHCAVGGRSARASRELQKMGFKNVIDFTDGFEGWKKAGKPIEK